MAADLLAAAVTVGEVVVQVSLGVLLTLGTYVGQGMTEVELLRERTFATTHALMDLGLNDLSTSWLVWFVTLILSLNALGLVLRATRLSPPKVRRFTGPAIDHAEWTSAQGLEDIAQIVAREVGSVRRLDGGLRARIGDWSEGLIVIIVALLCLFGALFTNHSLGMEARMGVMGGGAAPAADAPKTLVVQVYEEGHWIERQLPFGARCVETSLGAPKRGWRCGLTRTLPTGPNQPLQVEEATIELGPRWPDEAFGFVFHVAREQPRPSAPGPLRILDQGVQPARLVYQGPSGRSSTLPTEEALSAFAGPDGPLVVVTPKEGSPYLLAPSMDAKKAPEQVGEASLSAVVPWALRLRLSHRPGDPLLWTGLALLVLGLLALCLRPHLVVFAHEHEGEVRVRAWSFNRIGRVAPLQASLSARAEEEA